MVMFIVFFFSHTSVRIRTPAKCPENSHTVAKFAHQPVGKKKVAHHLPGNRYLRTWTKNLLFKCKLLRTQKNNASNFLMALVILALVQASLQV